MNISTPTARHLTTARTTVLALTLATIAFAGTAGASADSGTPATAPNAAAFPALPAGAHVLKSGTNQYGSYEFVEQPADSAGTVRPASGGGCNDVPGTGEVPSYVCLNVTGSGTYVSQMHNKSYFAVPGDAEVEILSPSKAELASWFGSISTGETVNVYWTPDANVPTGWYCGTSDSNPGTILSASGSYCVQVS